MCARLKITLGTAFLLCCEVCDGWERFQNLLSFSLSCLTLITLSLHSFNTAYVRFSPSVALSPWLLDGGAGFLEVL